MALEQFVFEKRKVAILGLKIKKIVSLVLGILSKFPWCHKRTRVYRAQYDGQSWAQKIAEKPTREKHIIWFEDKKGLNGKNHAKSKLKYCC